MYHPPQVSHSYRYLDTARAIEGGAWLVPRYPPADGRGVRHRERTRWRLRKADEGFT